MDRCHVVAIRYHVAASRCHVAASRCLVAGAHHGCTRALRQPPNGHDRDGAWLARRQLEQILIPPFQAATTSLPRPLIRTESGPSVAVWCVSVVYGSQLY